jgi:hypothetical protein
MTASPLDVPTAFDYIPTEADRGLTPPKEGPMTQAEQAASDALDIPRIVYPTKTVLGDGSVLVDKTIAESWLAANTHNRKLRNFRVDQMARNMKVGQSDTVQVFTVIAGLDDVVQRSIDIGGKRTVGDQLNLNGKSDGTTLASVARFAMEMQAWPRSFRPSEMEIVGIVENDDKLQWVVTHVNPTLPAILGSPTVRAYVYRVLHDVDPDACATFFSKLTTLDKLPSDSPILALYRRLATPDMRKDGMRGRVAMVTCYFIAWNAWRNGEPRQIIKPHSNAEGYVMPPKPV